MVLLEWILILRNETRKISLVHCPLSLYLSWGNEDKVGIWKRVSQAVLRCWTWSHNLFRWSWSPNEWAQLCWRFLPLDWPDRKSFVWNDFVLCTSSASGSQRSSQGTPEIQNFQNSSSPIDRWSLEHSKSKRIIIILTEMSAKCHCGSGENWPSSPALGDRWWIFRPQIQFLS